MHTSIRLVLVTTFFFTCFTSYASDFLHKQQTLLKHAYQAIDKGHNTQLRSLLQNNPTILNNKDTGSLLVRRAIEQHSLRCLELLLDHVDTSATDSEGNTILHIAIKNNFIEITKLVLKKCPHLLEVTNTMGVKPLTLALETSLWRLHILALIRAGAHFPFDIETLFQDSEGNTILHWSVREGSCKTTQLITQTYPHLLEVKNNQGQKPLTLATGTFLNPNQVIALIDAGAKCSVTDRGLEWACIDDVSNIIEANNEDPLEIDERNFFNEPIDALMLSYLPGHLGKLLLHNCFTPQELDKITIINEKPLTRQQKVDYFAQSIALIRKPKIFNNNQWHLVDLLTPLKAFLQNSQEFERVKQHAQALKFKNKLLAQTLILYEIDKAFKKLFPFSCTKTITDTVVILSK